MNDDLPPTAKVVLWIFSAIILFVLNCLAGCLHRPTVPEAASLACRQIYLVGVHNGDEVVVIVINAEGQTTRQSVPPSNITRRFDVRGVCVPPAASVRFEIRPFRTAENVCEHPDTLMVLLMEGVAGNFRRSPIALVSNKDADGPICEVLPFTSQ